jgi:hypothetical protein
MLQRPTRLVSSILLGLVLAACGSTVPSQPPATISPSPAATGTAVASDPAPTGSTPASSSPVAIGQTDTPWGRIWDVVPAGFPRFPGSTPADDASPDPASARYVVEGGDPQEMATWLQAALETATYSTLALSGPLEDGSFVLDSVGDGECRIESTIAPLGGMTFVTVRYGAACPGT